MMLQLLLLTFHFGAGHLATAAAANSKAVRYSLIIDSGSSGTRIYAYTWQPATQPGHLPLVTAVPPSQAAAKIPRKVKTGMYERVETQPGLSQYVGDTDDLNRLALQPLLDWARAVIPRSKWRCTPIFLLATAGVRKLDALQRATLLTAVQHVLAQSGFRFEPSWARIITGAEEGAFGWVAANYMSGGLSGPLGQPPLPPPAGGGQVSAGKHYEGTLDLGGSSLEVTRLQGTIAMGHSPEAAPHSQAASALPPGAKPQHSRHTPGSVADSLSVGMQETDLVVGGVTFQLLTTTYRRYGLSDTFDRSVSLLLQGLHDRSAMLSLATGGHTFSEPVPRPNTLAAEPGAVPLSAPPTTQDSNRPSSQEHLIGYGDAAAAGSMPRRQEAGLQQAGEQGALWDVDSAVRQQQVMVSAMTPEIHGSVSLQTSTGRSSSRSSSTDMDLTPRALATDHTRSALPSGIKLHTSQTAQLHYHDDNGVAGISGRRLSQAAAATQAAVWRVSQRMQQVQQSRAAHYLQQQQRSSGAAVAGGGGQHQENKQRLEQQQGTLLHGEQRAGDMTATGTNQRTSGLSTGERTGVQHAQWLAEPCSTHLPQQQQAGLRLSLQQQQQQAGQQTHHLHMMQQTANDYSDSIDEDDGWWEMQLDSMRQDSKSAAVCNTATHGPHLAGSQPLALTLGLYYKAVQQATVLWVQAVLQAVQHVLQALHEQVQVQLGPRSRSLLQVAETPPSSFGYEMREQDLPLVHKDSKRAVVIDHVVQPPGSQSVKPPTSFPADTDSRTRSSSSSGGSSLRGGYVEGQQAAHDIQDAEPGGQQGSGSNASVPDISHIQQLDHPCLPKGYDVTYSRLHDYGISVHLRVVRLLGTGMASQCQALAKTLVQHSLLLPACSPTATPPAISSAAPQPVVSHEQAFSATNQRGMSQAHAPSPYQSDSSSIVGGHGSARSTVEHQGLAKCDQGVASTQLQGRVMALTGFYVVWRFFLGAAGSAQGGTTGSANRDVLQQAVQDLCEKPWSHHSSTLGQHVNVEKYCLWGRYVLGLLGPHGMNLSETQVTIGSGDVGWPLGAALAEVSREAPDLLRYTATVHSTQFTSWWRRVFHWQDQQVTEDGCGYTVVVQDHVRTLRRLTAGVVLLVCVLGALAWWGPQLCRRVNRGLLRPWLGIGAVRHSVSERKLHAPPLLPMSRPIRNRSHSNLLSRYLSPG